jgi:glycerol kinase
MTVPAPLIAALDQGTTSTRCILFDDRGCEVSRAQREHRQIFPRPGWVEHDPVEIVHTSYAVIQEALDRCRVAPGDLVGLGITNQRETTVLWNRRTGRPYGNAIVWQDTRTDHLCAELAGDSRGSLVRQTAGIPVAPYFAGGKLAWILANDPDARRDTDRGDTLFGTIDSWLIWNLTGGVDGGRHVTDVTNASRTMLMDIATCTWSAPLLAAFDLPEAVLPEIGPSAHPERFGHTAPSGSLGAAVPILSALGDQHAAMLGQVCCTTGTSKNTYGTGSFLLLNTGAEPVRSDHGLLTTVCYQLPGEEPTYALEGSIAVTGSAIQWLRDQLGIISDAAESDQLARSVPDTGDVYIVPAFSGLFAPYWRPDARGTIVGLSRFSTRAHLTRAVLESICYQTRDVVAAMAADSGLEPSVLKVDGGVTANELCMQLQADILGCQISRPAVVETTALGAAYGAGLAAGVWPDTGALTANWREERRWSPTTSTQDREARYRRWQQAVRRSLDWATPPPTTRHDPQEQHR